MNGEDNLITSLLFAAAIVIGGFSLFKVGFQNLVRFDFEHENPYDSGYYWSSYYWRMGRGAVVVILFAISEVLERFRWIEQDNRFVL